MDYLWTPWRYTYIAGLQNNSGDCVFCQIAARKEAAGLIVHRAEYNYIVLNRFPYTSGHTMVVPYRHFGLFHELTPEEAAETMALTRRLQRALDAEYCPEGYNIGWNQGKCAGAGVAGHLHLHVIPRWVGDTNMVGAIGETRVLPEDLDTTLAKLHKHFGA
jgi:ATP adenylyltransferase